MGGTLKVFSVRGIPISIHASWVAIYALITWTLAVGYFPHVLPDVPAVTYWASGLIAALLLFVSVLLHELSHSFVAIAHGLRVRGITLHVFGGVSQLEDEAPSPRAEFLIAAAGPLASFALAALLWLGAGLVTTPSARAIVGYLVFTNTLVGVFNLIPGFPLDGGRLLRALLWRWKGNLARATATASRVGVAVAFGLIGIGVMQILGGGLIGGLWLILIGLFLRSAADASYAQVALREALAPLPVRDVMSRDVVSVRPDTTISELVEQFWSHHFTSFPVVRDGAVEGIATVHQIDATPPEQRARRTVQEVMRPIDDALVIRPWDSAFRALEKASANGLGRLAVIDGSRIAGYLSLKDITHVLALRGINSATARSPARAPFLRRAA